MKYDAFISYRHLEKDMYVAKKVHRALETAKIPKKIQKEIGRKKINRVFRDQEELPIGSDLGSNIEAALREAEFLVVICSPQTKESYWVMKEIDTFISMHGRENILAVLVDGEPSDSFPAQILTDENGNPVEPLAADVRGEKKKIIKRKLKTEGMRLAAAILKVDYDDLKQRHKERQMRKVIGFSIGVAAVITAFAVAFGLYNAYNLDKINAEYQQKLINESKVLAAQSENALENGDRTTAVLLAMEGLPQDGVDRPFVEESMDALSNALDCYDIGDDMVADGILTHNLQVEDFNLNEDASRLISCDNSGFVYVWDLENQKELFEIQPRYTDDGEVEKIKDIGFSKDLNIVCTDNGVYGYDNEGKETYHVSPDGYGFRFSAIREVNDSVYVITSTDTQLWLIDANTGEITKKYDNHLTDYYFDEASFSNDGNYLAISHFFTTYDQEEEILNCCTIYNLTTDEYVDVPITAGYTIDLKADTDGSFYVFSINSDSLMEYEDTPMYLQKIDYQTGEILWEQTAVYEGTVFASNNSMIAVGERETDDGNKESLVAISGTQSVYVYNGATGEAINTINVGDSLLRIAFNIYGTRLAIGTANGKLSYFPVDANTSYMNSATDITDEQMLDFHMANGVLVARCFRSPDLLIMRFRPDDSLLYSYEPEGRVTYTDAYSPDGSTYVTRSNTVEDDIDSGQDIVVHDSLTGEVKASVHIDDLFSSFLAGSVKYVDNDHLYMVGSAGVVYRYTISKGKLDSLETLDDSISADSYYSENLEYILVYGTREYCVIKTSDMKVVHKGIVSDDFSVPYMDGAIITPDGTIIYYIDSEKRLHSFDISSGKNEMLLEEYYCNGISISGDGQKFAVATTDGKLRLFAQSNLKQVDELEFYSGKIGQNSNLIKFSPDSNLLLLQGEDLYVKMYDLEKKEIVFSAPYQVNEITSLAFDEDVNRLALSSGLGMFVIDLNTYGQLAYIPNANMYIPHHQIIISKGNYGYSDVYAFKFKELDELIAIAKEKYGDCELTDAQKAKYGVQ